MPQTDGAELFRVQPDAPPAPPSDEGIHSWPIGSFAPMGFYRPTPIVHFSGTMLVQFVLGFLLQALLAGAPGVFTIGACTVLALVLARRAIGRWLLPASARWKLATFTGFALNLLFVSFITLARGCGPGQIRTGLEKAAVARSTASEGCQPSLAELLAPYGDDLQ